MKRAGLFAGFGFMLAGQAAQAAPLGQVGDDGVAWWRVAAALIFCLLLAVGGAFALRSRLGGGVGVRRPTWLRAAQTTRRLELVETLRVKPQVDLLIVRCDGRQLLISASAQGAELIERLDDGTKPA